MKLCMAGKVCHKMHQNCLGLGTSTLPRYNGILDLVHCWVHGQHCRSEIGHYNKKFILNVSSFCLLLCTGKQSVVLWVHSCLWYKKCLSYKQKSCASIIPKQVYQSLVFHLNKVMHVFKSSSSLIWLNSMKQNLRAWNAHYPNAWWGLCF